MITKIAMFLGSLCLTQSYIVDPGPVVIATKGEVWPLPQEIETEEYFYVIKTLNFQFQSIGYNCSLLNDAFQRYWDIIHSAEKLGRNISKKSFKNGRSKVSSESYIGMLEKLYVELKQPCTGQEIPAMDMDESYKLFIGSGVDGASVIISESIWGALRGLETFSQLIYLTNEYNPAINVTIIKDFPRFPHRGLLLDTSRHFIPMHLIFKNLEAMAYNKLNVFHWHIVDDHSFPYQSTRFPELSDKGAYHPVLKIYTQDDVQRVIEYARVRGIRVMAEFDTPGHTRSWGEGIKNILTPCYENGEPSGQFGPMDPTSPFLYKFVDELFEEVINVFPEKYLHLGADEVEFECWKSNPNITDFMARNNMTDDYVALESYYIQKLLDIVTKRGAESLVWEEVFTNGVDLPNNTVVHVWKGIGYSVLKKVCTAGKPALFSSCWYLDHLATGGDWEKYYWCDPHNFNGTPEELNLVKGGEACMWAESVNEFNVVSRIWPRASAAAEKLWSKKDADTIKNAARRLEEQTCRMNYRGIAAQPPNGPGFCL